MKFQIPFTLAPLDKLKNRAKIFSPFTSKRKNLKLQKVLDHSEIPLTEREYRMISIRGFVNAFLIIFIISTTSLVLANIQNPFLLGGALSLLSAFFVMTSQRLYPFVYDKKRIKNIERNLIPSLQDMLVQLNSGIPLFNILVNISSSDYGELSKEFSKAVKRINTGDPEVDVLEDLGESNASLYFKRTLWQISNGMRAGSDISIVVEESIKSLNEEQLLQIQNYGNKLNPMIMFYLLISVVLPALSIAFLTIITSMVGISRTLTIALFVGLGIIVLLIQTMFLGLIRSTRPSLL